MKAKAIVAMVAALILTGSMVREGKGTSFELHGYDPINDPINDPMLVNTAYELGSLYDYRKAWVGAGGVVDNIVAWDHSEVSLLSDGKVGYLRANGNSIVNISGGVGNYDIVADHSSTVSVTGGRVLGDIVTEHTSTVNISGDGYVYYIDNSASVNSTVKISGGHVGIYWAWSPVNISGGWVETLWADGTSVVTMSGGAVNVLAATGTNTVNMSGGQVDYISAYATSPLIFNAYDLTLGVGLSRSGNQVWGSGVLTGEWYGGQPFSTIINGGATGAVPEPLTMLTAFLAVGSLGGYLMRRVKGK